MLGTNGCSIGIGLCRALTRKGRRKKYECPLQRSTVTIPQLSDELYVLLEDVAANKTLFAQSSSGPALKLKSKKLPDPELELDAVDMELSGISVRVVVGGV